MEKRPLSRPALPLAPLPKASGPAAKRTPTSLLLINTAASAAALLTLSGCGLFGADTPVEKPATRTPTPPPVDATNLADTTARDLDTYSKRVADALAAQNKAAPTVTVTPVTTTVTPATAAPTPNPYQPTASLVEVKPTPSSSGTIVTTRIVPAAPIADSPPPQSSVPVQPTFLATTTTVEAMGAASVTTVQQPPAAEASLTDLMTVLRQRAQANPRQLNYALAQLLLESAENNKAPDPATLSYLSPNDQKLLTDLATSVQALAATTPAQGTSLADRAEPLLSTAKNWQAQADLKLPRLLVASRVDSFGVFTAVEPKFPNGKRSTVIIYCEVANFTSQKTPAPTGDDPVYLTHLTQQDTLITDDGLLVWRPNPEDIEDRSHNLRHDFYLVKKLTLPDTLPVGKYTLRMTVTDKLSSKIAMTSLPIEIVAK